VGYRVLTKSLMNILIFYNIAPCLLVKASVSTMHYFTAIHYSTPRDSPQNVCFQQHHCEHHMSRESFNTLFTNTLLVYY
jgi:hypothetical protein